MHRICLAAACLFAFSQGAFSQVYPEEWEEFTTPAYYFSLKHEKSGSLPEAECLEKLLGAARAEVASQIKIKVDVHRELNERDVNGVAESVYTASSNFSTDVTLRFVETRTYYDRRKKEGYALAFLLKEDLEDLYKARALKVRSMLDIARNAERELKFDAALKYDYWAQILNATLPIDRQPEYEGVAAHMWARSRMEEILSHLQFTYVGRTEDDPLLGTLDVTFDGRPVTSLDYTYNDGLGESAPQQVRDGLGAIEFRSGIEVRNVDIKVEYAYRYESKSDPEMMLAMEEVTPIRFAGALKSGVSVRERQTTDSPRRLWKRKKAKAETAMPATEPVSAAMTSEINSGFSRMELSRVKDSTFYIGTVNKVLDAIQAQNYDGCRDLFSEEGYDVFNRLIHYGNAKVIRRGPIKCMSCEGAVCCRSIPMKFSFQNNVKTFLENVVFSFDGEGKIDGISFALESDSVQDILSKTKWEDAAKMVLINFLEAYKTSFALKNLEYISSVFSDDALIITGRKVKRTAIEGGIQLTGEAFEYNRQTKAQYMSNLRRSFNSKEYINLQFSNVSVLKTTKGTNSNLYGIQVRQDYYSSNYGDSGYLYLLVDIADHTRPLIYVRTWQPEPDLDVDPETGIYGINNI